LVVAFALLATACSGEEPESSSSKTTASSSQTALSGVTIAASSVEEMDVLRFAGLNPEDDLSDVDLSILVASGVTSTFDRADG